MTMTGGVLAWSSFPKTRPLNQWDAQGLEVIWHRGIDHYLGFHPLSVEARDPARQSRSVPPLPLNGSPRTSEADCTPGTSCSRSTTWLMKIPLGGGLFILTARQSIFEGQQLFSFKPHVNSQQACRNF